MSHAVVGEGNWSEPNSWQAGTVPKSSNGLNVTLAGSSMVDVGTVSDPFLVQDIKVGLAPVQFLFMSNGFLQAHDISAFPVLQWGGVLGNRASGLEIRHDAVNTDFLQVGSGDTVEIGHDFTDSTFSFSRSILGTRNANGETLILDRVPGKSFDNRINMPNTSTSLTKVFSLKIELGNLTFDQADFLPNAPGSTTGDLRLSSHGYPVYDMTNVFVPGAGTSDMGTFSVGVDPRTGYDYVAYTHT